MKGWLSVLVSLGLLAHNLVAADSRATGLLAQARAAVGGDSTLVKVQAFSLEGTFTRAMPDGPHTGELKIDVQLPDKMLRTDSGAGPMGGVFQSLRGINGDTLLRNSKIINGGPGARMSLPPLAGGTEALALRSAREDLSRFALALLLTAPASMPIELTYGGEAQSPDGRADLLDAKGPDGFAARLFLDKTSHRPLLLTYQGFDPRMFPMASSQSAQPSQRGAVAAPPRTEPASTSPTPQTVEITLFLDDYRAEQVVLLPHHVSRAVEGTIDEDWTFKTVRLNPVFKPGAFSDK